MYLADYHVHSRVSPDASASMAEMAEAAIRQGLHELCFTDHVEPIRFGTTEPRADYDWAPMAAEFAAARAAAGDRIQLRLGAELGDAVWGTERMEAVLAKAPELDFTIGSIHTLSEGQGGRDLYFLSPKDEGETRACLADYLGQVRKLAEWGRFQVLGHLTLPLRYLNEGRGLHASFDGFEAEMEDIFRTIIPKGNRHRAEHQPGQHPPAGREVAADVPGAGGRDRHPGHRCPQPRRGGLCRPGGAGPSARVRFHTLLHLPAGHAGVARIVICNFGNIWL